MQKNGKDAFFKSLKTKTTIDNLAGSFIPLGQAGRPHGLRGELCFLQACVNKNEENNRKDLLKKLLHQNIQARKGEKIVLAGKAESLRPHKKYFILKIEGADTIEQAKLLTGSKIFAPKHLFKSLKGQDIYLCEVLGFEVYDRKRRRLGKVSGFADNGAQDLLKVLIDCKKEELCCFIPFVDSLVKNVDFKTRKIAVDLPFSWPGLDDEFNNNF